MSDAKYSALVMQGATPATIDDMERQWLAGLGIAIANTNDMWMARFNAIVPSTAGKDWNDAAYAYLASFGHTQGTLDERWLAYWVSLGPP